MSYWRRIGGRGWELRHNIETQATVWWQPDLNASSKAHWVFFIRGFRINYEGFKTRAAAMRAAEGHIMGWICSQFRIGNYVFAEVKARPQHLRGKRWYFETRRGRSEERYWSQAEAFSAAEEAVLDMILDKGWIFDVEATAIDRIKKPRRS